MFQGEDQLRRAKETLNGVPGEPCDRHRLLIAALEFLSATHEGDPWPLDLQARTIPMRFRLVRHGSVNETVRRMDETDVRELCHDLRLFAEDAERLAVVARRV